jgi:two-component system LytT family response regulator
MIKLQSPALMFLDIQMPEMNGFEVLEQIASENLPVIVFVTAFDKYALKAFEVHALDYLLKPFDDARFEKALRQAKKQIEDHEITELSRRLLDLLDERGTTPAPPPRAERYLTRLMIKNAGRVTFLKTEDVDWIEADNYYAKLHTEKKAHLLRESLNDLEARLDPRQFARVHRSAIVNLDRVKELQTHVNGEQLVVLLDGTELKLSRSRREELQNKLKISRR